MLVWMGFFFFNIYLNENLFNVQYLVCIRTKAYIRCFLLHVFSGLWVKMAHSQCSCWVDLSAGFFHVHIFFIYLFSISAAPAKAALYYALEYKWKLEVDTAHLLLCLQIFVCIVYAKIENMISKQSLCHLKFFRFSACLSLRLVCLLISFLFGIQRAAMHKMFFRHTCTYIVYA